MKKSIMFWFLPLCMLLMMVGCEKCVVPTVTTSAVSNVTQTTANSGGEVTSDGGLSVTARGVCWNISTNPTTANSKTTDGTGTGSFVSTLTSLTANTTYYVRAYATNSEGTAYGAEVSFKTAANLPTVITTSATIMGTTTAVGGGNITSDGGSAIIARGVCWDSSTGPTINGSKSPETGTASTFICAITGLTAGKTYYVRAYATNSAGTGYGNELTITTKSTNGIIFNPNLTYGSLTDLEGNIYKTIQIGTQIWMAENLKSALFKDGTIIPHATDKNAWGNLSTPGFCWYNNDVVSNRDVYGGLYNWYAVNTTKLCPTGWHVPSETEWTVLRTFLGGQAIAGGKLKETGMTHWVSPNFGATNESGFAALPGGNRGDGTTYDFFNLYYIGTWWSSSEINAAGIAHYMHRDLTELGYTNPDKRSGFSVRCVKD